MEKLLNINELANVFGLTLSGVRSLVHERRIPYLKVGRLVRFSPSEVQAWLAANSSAAVPGRSRPRNNKLPRTRTVANEEGK